MKTRKFIYAIDTHTAGEPTRIVPGVIYKIPGSTIREKRDFFRDNMDHVRTILMHEPRGHQDMFGAILVEPTNEISDMGVIFIEPNGYINMCGHALIGIVTATLETGMIPPKDQVTIETPIGVIKAKPELENGRVKSVTIRFEDVPSFFYTRRTLQIPGKDSISVDIAFGGNFVALIEAKELGLKVNPHHLESIVPLGLEIKRIINETVEVHHPLLDISWVDLVEFCDEPTHPGANSRNVVILGEGLVDRSPCGVGTCAKMASLHSKGELGFNEEFIHESILGTLLVGRLVGKAKVSGIDAVIPEITGSAYITGFHHFLVEPDDPLGHGFLL